MLSSLMLLTNYLAYALLCCSMNFVVCTVYCRLFNFDIYHVQQSIIIWGSRLCFSKTRSEMTTMWRHNSLRICAEILRKCHNFAILHAILRSQIADFFKHYPYGRHVQLMLEPGGSCPATQFSLSSSGYRLGGGSEVIGALSLNGTRRNHKKIVICETIFTGRGQCPVNKKFGLVILCI